VPDRLAERRALLRRLGLGRDTGIGGAPLAGGYETAQAAAAAPSMTAAAAATPITAAATATAAVTTARAAASGSGSRNGLGSAPDLPRTLPNVALLVAPSTRRWPWAAAAAALLLATALAWPPRPTGLAVATAAPAEPAPAAGALPPAAALPASDGIVLEAAGLVSAQRMATVSPRTTGQLVEALVDEGSTVQRGQLLARLDDRQASTDLALAQAQLAAADANVAGARATLADAQRVFEREQELHRQQFTSAARLGSAQSALDAATAALDSARAAREVAALQVQRRHQTLDDHLVRAPFDGVVMARNAQTGEFVAPGSAGGFTRTGVFTIVDLGSLEIVVDVNEQHIRRVHAGQPVRATLVSDPSLVLEGRVLRVMPAADRAKATVRVRIALATQDPRVLPDMAVQVAFHDAPPAIAQAPQTGAAR
jgi:RND family efflux transporter MFP subunit